MILLSVKDIKEIKRTEAAVLATKVVTNLKNYPHPLGIKLQALLTGAVAIAKVDYPMTKEDFLALTCEVWESIR